MDLDFKKASAAITKVGSLLARIGEYAWRILSFSPADPDHRLSKNALCGP